MCTSTSPGQDLLHRLSRSGYSAAHVTMLAGEGFGEGQPDAPDKDPRASGDEPQALAIKLQVRYGVNWGVKSV